MNENKGTMLFLCVPFLLLLLLTTLRHVHAVLAVCVCVCGTGNKCAAVLTQLSFIQKKKDTKSYRLQNMVTSH